MPCVSLHFPLLPPPYPPIPEDAQRVPVPPPGAPPPPPPYLKMPSVSLPWLPTSFLKQVEYPTYLMGRSTFSNQL